MAKHDHIPALPRGVGHWDSPYVMHADMPTDPGVQPQFRVSIQKKWNRKRIPGPHLGFKFQTYVHIYPARVQQGRGFRRRPSCSCDRPGSPAPAIRPSSAISVLVPGSSRRSIFARTWSFRLATLRWFAVRIQLINSNEQERWSSIALVRSTRMLHRRTEMEMRGAAWTLRWLGMPVRCRLSPPTPTSIVTIHRRPHAAATTNQPTPPNWWVVTDWWVFV